jgi:hypothetical protein
MHFVNTGKLTLLERILLLSLYITIFESFFRRFFGVFGMEYIVLATIYFISYLLPVFLSLSQKFRGVYLNNLLFLIALNIFYFILLIIPFQKDIGYIYALNGLKNYYYPLIMIAVVGRVVINNPSFYTALIKNYIVVSTIISLYVLFEVFSRYYFHNDLLVYVANLAFNKSLINLENGGVRPLGLMLSYYHNAAVIGISIIFLFIYKKQLSNHYFVLLMINLTALLLCLSKTYSIATLLFLILYSFARVEIGIWIKMSVVASIIGVILIAIDGFAAFETIIQYYDAYFVNSDGRTKAVPLMIEKFGEFDYVLGNSLLPNGFQPELFVTLEGVDSVYAEQEIFLYKYIYQIGFFGFLLYSSIFIYLLIKSKFSAVFIGISFIIFLGFIHYSVINKLYVIIILSAVGARYYELNLHKKIGQQV